ncbi:MAG: M50 family metallopeptidase [Nakamurella sp.]
MRPSRGWPLSAAIAIIVVSFVAGRVLRDPPAPVVALFSVALVALLIVGVLLHEFGHLIAARWAGQRVLGIRFDILGGRTDIVGESRGHGRDALVALAGPVVSILLAAFAALVATLFTPQSLPWLLAMAIALINGLLAVFNLLPALPLDGGEILRSLLLAIGVRRSVAARAVLGGSLLVGTGLLAAALLVGSRGDLPTAVVLVGIGVHLGAIAVSAARHERLAAADHADPIFGDPETGADQTAGAPGAGRPAIVLTTDSLGAVSAALTTDPAERWLLIDDEGDVVSVWSREELTRILSDRSADGRTSVRTLPAHPPSNDDRTA